MSRPECRSWVVVGAGLVGLSVARSLGRCRPHDAVTVLEKSRDLAAHQSGRNSGVIHSTVNYRPGSLKATLVGRGRRELIEYCLDAGIDVAVRGKWIAATDAAEAARLDEIEGRGRANGETGLRIVERDELREREPNLRADRALWVPSTGVVDFRGVAIALAADLERRGGTVHRGTEVLAVDRDRRGHVVTTTVGDFRCDQLVLAAGLQSDRLCAMLGLDPPARIVPFAGHYAELAPARRTTLNHTVYGVPSARLPFLGVHFTRTIDDRWTIGPTALLTMRREPYAAPRRAACRDLADTLRYAGSWRLFRAYWRDGAREVHHHVRRSVRIADVQRYVPSLEARDIVPASTAVGVRAQAVDRAGHLVDDFLFAKADGALAVLNAPSPAATACLAIGDEIVDRALRASNLDRSGERDP